MELRKMISDASFLITDDFHNIFSARCNFHLVKLKHLKL
jgi:hypothetical protein